MMYASISSEGFAHLNQALHALQGLALGAEFEEGPTLEVEQVLLMTSVRALRSPPHMTVPGFS